MAAAFYLPRFPFRDNRLNIRCLPQLSDRHTAGHGRVGTAFSHGSRAADHGFSAYQRRIYDVVRIFGSLDLVASGAGGEQRFGRQRGEGKRGNNRTEEENFRLHIWILSWIRHRFIALPIQVKPRRIKKPSTRLKIFQTMQRDEIIENILRGFGSDGVIQLFE